MKQNTQSASDIAARLRTVDDEEFAVLERSLAADTRKTVISALESTRRRLAAQARERERIERIYLFQERIAEGRVIVGLDEVGRGPLAGPLTVGAVVLPPNPRIEGLNDSKQVAPELREQLATEIKQIAIA
jgi:ribonuclease HII